MEKLAPVPILSLSFHSFGQYWLWPYGYSKKAVPDNLKDLKEIAFNATKALKNVHGTEFTAQSSIDLCNTDKLQVLGQSQKWKTRFNIREIKIFSLP